MEKSLYDWCIENNRKDLLKEYSDKNEKSPKKISYGSHYKALWIYPYDDKKTGKHFDFEWNTEVRYRTIENGGCPYLAPNPKIMEGFNDLKTWCENNDRQDLIQQFSPKNLLPMTAYSRSTNQKVLWFYPYDDPETGKHFDFEWEAAVSSRTEGNGCPYLTNHLVWEGYNDLKTWCIKNNKTELIDEFSVKNEKPITKYLYGSENVVLWTKHYDDPKTGKHHIFEWKSPICERTIGGHNCPYLTQSPKVWVGYNDLKTWCIENNRLDLISQYSPKNKKDMTQYTYGHNGKVWWIMPYEDPITGKHFDFEWKAQIKTRTSKESGCPYLAASPQIYIGFNDLKTWCECNNHKELIEQWSPKNKKDMTQYTYGHNEKVWWIMPYDDPITGKHFDFEWESRISDRTIKNATCPYLTGHAIWIGYNDLVSTHPDIAKEWHPTKNGKKQPCNYSKESRGKFWWHKTYFDPITHKMTYLEWEQRLQLRTTNKSDCPLLSGSAMEIFIYQYLFDKKITFEKEKKFKELKLKRFDIYIKDLNMIIEFDGVQHFTDEIPFFEKERKFSERINSDNIKNKYCFDNKTKLLRIPYTYSQDTTKLKLIIDNFIATGKVPKEIIDFYSQFSFSNYIELCI